MATDATKESWMAQDSRGLAIRTISRHVFQMEGLGCRSERNEKSNQWGEVVNSRGGKGPLNKIKVTSG